MSKMDNRILVVYCPELDELTETPASSGFVFKDEFGEFFLVCAISGHLLSQTKKFYIIGDL